MRHVESQNKKITRFLENGGRISQIIAYELFNCLILASRISDIKAKGYDVKTKMIRNRCKRYAEYYL